LCIAELNEIPANSSLFTFFITAFMDVKTASKISVGLSSAFPVSSVISS
ncbi:hypothetical protein NT05LM_3158, partial [Listeria marthii FSL S4-120]